MKPQFITIKLILLALLLSSNRLIAAEYCDQTQLYSYMNDIKTELKSLAFDIKKEKYAAAQQRSDKVIELLTLSQQEVPFLFLEQELSGETLKSKIATYKQATTKTIELFTQLSLAIKQQNNAEIKPILAKISQARKNGHRQFKAKC